MQFVTAGLNLRLGEINELLEQDAKLAACDYRFQVLSLENGVVGLSSPRSPEMPAVRFLSILQPRLATKPATTLR